MKLFNVIYCGDNLEWMGKMPDEFVDLIYADPPFFSNRHYEVIWKDGAEIRSFEDRWQGGIYHYVEWMKERCIHIHRLLKPTGSFYLHCDWHANHYLKVMLDEIFGMENFQNEIIWWYLWGGRSKKRWSRKHDTILFYSKGPKFTFNFADVLDSHTLMSDASKQRLRYKGALITDYQSQSRPIDRGKVLPSDIWYVPTINAQAKERLGFPTQKPEALLERMVQASSNKGDLVFDPFCGCGTSVAVAHRLSREWMGIDVSPTACKLMKRRLEHIGAEDVETIGLPMTLKELKALNPLEFQYWVIGAMGGMPCKKTGDLGIDGFSFLEHVPIQVKQQEHVGRPVVDDFETALRRQGESALKAAKERKNSHFVLQGIVVAFSFTKGAHEEVACAKGEGLDIQLLTVTEVVKEFET